eukprot:494977_1
MAIPFGIHDIASYLESKRMNAIKMHIPHSKNVLEITVLLEKEITRRIAKLSNVLCIVDRRHDDCDVLYIIHTDTHTRYTLDEFNRKYAIELEFSVSNTVQCHLHYGNGRTRFYPEHLTTIMPRFFAQDRLLNYAQTLDELYEDSYKHGFAA